MKVLPGAGTSRPAGEAGPRSAAGAAAPGTAPRVKAAEGAALGTGAAPTPFVVKGETVRPGAFTAPAPAVTDAAAEPPGATTPAPAVASTRGWAADKDARRGSKDAATARGRGLMFLL
jgi:hypothetical protein